jgi:hypothetical protein
MKLIKTMFANVHLFFAGIFGGAKSISTQPLQATAVTPIGELDLSKEGSSVEKETTTWYGVRTSLCYFVYKGGVASHLVTHRV